MPPHPIMPPGYQRRRPEETVLYQVLQKHLETFLALADESTSGGLPEFVVRELRGFLRCGLLCYGFARLHCATCNDDLLVPFSCRGRGFCPSCTGRTMADTAAHLVDRVIPRVPVRQWVLSLPYQLRYKLAYDTKLRTEVLAIFVRVVTGHYRREAKRRGLVDSRCGGVTSIQRAGSGLRLNLHYHTLMCDGVFTRASAQAPPQFHAIGVTDEDVASVVATVRRRVMRLLERRGLLGDEDSAGPDPLQESDPLLAACYQASVQGHVATGERAGCGVRREKGKAAPKVQVKNELCANIDGFDLHARTRIPRHKREALERLCRYVLRPPVATDRLRWVDERRTLVALDLKRPWADGTSSFIFTRHGADRKARPLDASADVELSTLPWRLRAGLVLALRGSGVAREGPNRRRWRAAAEGRAPHPAQAPLMGAIVDARSCDRRPHLLEMWRQTQNYRVHPRPHRGARDSRAPRAQLRRTTDRAGAGSAAAGVRPVAFAVRPRVQDAPQTAKPPRCDAAAPHAYALQVLARQNRPTAARN